MATIRELDDADQLFKYDAALSWREFEDRYIYVLPHVRDAMLNEVPSWEPEWTALEPPAEQMDALLYEYCVGEELEHRTKFHCLRRVGDGVWELKSTDIRMFGFFYRKDCFICTDIDQAGVVKAGRLYDRYSAQAVAARESLDLDPPSHVAGDDPNDVVSNWS